VDGVGGASATGVRRGDRVAGGVALLVIGLFLLVVQTVPDLGRLIPLFLGSLLLAMGILRREQGLIIAGCVVGGVGLGVALQGAVTGVEAGAVVVLSLGLGFVAIYAISLLLGLPEAHWWPLIPGGIILFVGVVIMSGPVIGDAMRWWPVALIAVGLLVVARALLRHPSSSRR
jgi:hypothetical protein